MEHPRIAQLRSQVHNLPLDGHCRAVLLQSIEYLREPIVARARPAPHQRRDELKVLQRAALSGMMERALHEQYSG
jgi:hypothetical protein